MDAMIMRTDTVKRHSISILIKQIPLYGIFGHGLNNIGPVFFIVLIFPCQYQVKGQLRNIVKNILKAQIKLVLSLISPFYAKSLKASIILELLPDDHVLFLVRLNHGNRLGMCGRHIMCGLKNDIPCLCLLCHHLCLFWNKHTLIIIGKHRIKLHIAFGSLDRFAFQIIQQIQILDLVFVKDAFKPFPAVT